MAAVLVLMGMNLYGQHLSTSSSQSLSSLTPPPWRFQLKCHLEQLCPGHMLSSANSAAGTVIFASRAVMNSWVGHLFSHLAIIC